MPLKPRFTLATKLAQKLLADSKIEYPPVPLQPILDQLEVKLLPHDFPKDKVSAVLMRIEGIVVIGVNKNHHTNRQRFSIAHEIGHYKLGHHVEFLLDPNEVADGRFDTTQENTLQEQEANHFASELLLPSENIRNDFKQSRNAKELAERYEVSEQALWIRLMKLKLV